jgi:HemY protein
MRAALWFMALFGIAVASALFAGNNQAVVTVFWPPHRVDLSLNLTVLLLAVFFTLLYAALRALSAVFSLPAEARRWRAQQKERAMSGALMDALSHQLAGRYIRATRAAENALAQEKMFSQLVEEEADMATAIGHRASQLRSLAHLLVAESAQSLQNRPLRDEHLALALQSSGARQAQEVREGVQFRAARWALDDRDAALALDILGQLPHGAARRTLALRMKLRATRQLRQFRAAIDTARLLAKHRAFSADAAQSLVRGLALEVLNDAHDPQQLQQAWSSLENGERGMPELAVHAASRLMALQGDAATARGWLRDIWPLAMQPRSPCSDALRVSLIEVMQTGLDSLDADWLARIEAAVKQRPRDANLHYLAGMACLSRQLWGKAQQLLTQAAPALQDASLRRHAWKALALLAEQRGDAGAAADAYRKGAQS